MHRARRSNRPLFVLAALVLLTGCQEEVEPDLSSEGSSSQAQPGDDDVGDEKRPPMDVDERAGDAVTPGDTAGPEPDVRGGPIDQAPDVVESDDGVIQASHWCEAGRGGEAGARPLAQDLARVHVSHRLFGTSADWLGADATLVNLLQDDVALDEAFIGAYAEAFPEVCALESASSNVSEAKLEKHGTTVVIRPGSGSVALPQSAEVVIIDLRTAHTLESIRAALELVLVGEVEVATRGVRRFHGFPAQTNDWTHYEVSDVSLPLRLEGESAIERTLLLWTPLALTPEVATLVGGLRLLGRAAIVGHHVHAAVAESFWAGVGEGGLMWRASSLESGGSPWPDLIRADFESDKLQEILDALPLFEDLPPLTEVPTRPTMASYERGAGQHDATLDRATMRAAMLVAYGTLDLFYTYFDLVGRGLDGALLDALGEIAQTADGDRAEMERILKRFMHHLHDGHGFTWDDAKEDWPDGWMALQIQGIDGLPVVRSSLSPGIEPGDTITAVDGVPITDWYDEAMRHVSASSEGYRFVLATDALKEVYGAPTWTLMDPEGLERQVTAMASDYDDVSALPWGGSLRPSGWLDTLGAPDVYFVNMASAVTPEIAGVVSELASAGDMAGVILDMRDYPSLEIYEFARSFNPEHFSAPLFGFPTWYGPWDFGVEFEAWEFDPAPHVVDAPVILLVSNKSVSAAECFSQMVMGLDQVTVVGQQSASTNGTITTFWLPGRFELTFTGMRLTNPDGSQFHGIGVVPDVEVTPSPSEFAQGLDPELMVALELLGGVE